MGEKDRKGDKSERERKIGRETGVGERDTGEIERERYREKEKKRQERERDR